MTTTAGDAQQLRERLHKGREPLRERASGPGLQGAPRVGLSLGQAHAAMLDRLLQELFQTAVATDAAPAGGALSLAAVGGYGRRALALGADLDLRILTRDLTGVQARADALLYPMWDAGLSVGHQVVTPDALLESAITDLPSATSLLDWRYIAGDEALSDELLRRARHRLFSTANISAFLERLRREVTTRHARFGGSVYLLEPDVKNGAGGLRDVDIAWWAARARWGVVSFDGLVAIGVLLRRQVDAVKEAQERMWRIRNLLHDRSGRRQDRLRFDEQEAVADLLGYLERGVPLGHGVERMMSDHYSAARTISRFRELILDQAEPSFRRHKPTSRTLGAGLQLIGQEVTLRDLDSIHDQPAIVFRALDMAVHLRLALRPTLRHAIIEAAGDEAWTARLREAPGAGAMFVKLLTTTKPTYFRRGSVMREMHDLGLLLAMLPEFAPVVGRVHHDTYHVYTVDVHSVAAVDRLGEVARGDIILEEDEGDRWAGSLACRLGTEIARPAVLFLATLLHDVGKAIGSRGHSERGAVMAREILARLNRTGANLEPTDVDEVARLIEHHLTMYMVATRRDLDDPATAQEIADIVHDQEGLRNLYLLTVADLSTTSPTSMTSWKARMLDDLYVVTARLLRRHEGDPSLSIRHASLAQKKADALRCMADGTSATAAPGVGAVIAAMVSNMPGRYTRGQDAYSIHRHAEVVAQHLHRGAWATVAIVPPRGARPEGLAGPTQICLVAADSHGLLAQITAALAQCRLHVHAAQIHSFAIDEGGEGRRLALDLFWVERAGGDEVRPLLPKLERTLASLLEGEAEGPDIVPRAPRSLRAGPEVPTRVIVDTRVAPHHTVVEVFSLDRPGVLFRIAHALFHQGMTIELAKISTEGSRVVDVFYVTDQRGAKVTDRGSVRKLRQAIVASLAEEQPEA